jgi:hypothetical protein
VLVAGLGAEVVSDSGWPELVICLTFLSKDRRGKKATLAISGDGVVPCWDAPWNHCRALLLEANEDRVFGCHLAFVVVD